MMSQLRQMKDFLEIFNKVTENCFNNCVNTFGDREVAKDEAICIDRCVAKFLKSSHAVMSTYVEIQPKLVEKRIQEFNQTAEKNSLVETQATS